MSIIHEALKKVQASEYIYAPAPAAQTPTPNGTQKPPAQKKIPSILAKTSIVVITTAVSIASLEYIYQQLQIKVPQVQSLARKSLSTLNKILLPKPPAALKPLAQLTINSPANAQIVKPPAAATLNIHGIMSNASGNLALINDQVYQEGDEVDGAKIVKINLDSITVIVNGTQQTIHVKNQ